MELDNITDNKLSKHCSCCQLKKKKTVDVSIPGLGRLMDPSYGKKSKLVWLLIVLCCTVACAYLTVDRLMHYFDVPLMTKVGVKRIHMVTFPAFTICSNNMLSGLKPLMKLKVLEECIARNRSDCESESELENISFRDLNVSLENVWNEHILTDIEISIVGMLDKSINVKEYLLKGNKTSDSDADVSDFGFEFTTQDIIVGSCVIIRHTGSVPYLSTATSLTVHIHETPMIPNSKLAYTLIPHGEPDDQLTRFEFLTNEFEELKAGYEYKLKLHQENFHLKNTSHRVCFDPIEEIERIEQCATDLLQPLLCRLPGCPENYSECESLKDVPEIVDSKFNSFWMELSTFCYSRPVCKDTQYIIFVDTTMRKEDSENTTIIIRMSDDTIDIVEQVIEYTFPDLVSDLFAYWGFFLCLSALVFAEIFEYLIKKLRECIKKHTIGAK